MITSLVDIIKEGIANRDAKIKHLEFELGFYKALEEEYGLEGIIELMELAKDLKLKGV